MERGSNLMRSLDVWMGIPLVALLGSGRRIRKIVAPAGRPLVETRKIGVLCLGAIGDLLLATGAIGAVYRAFPGVSLEILTSKSNAAAHALLPPEYRTVSFPVKDVTGIIRHVRTARYDVLFDFGQWPRISSLIAAVSAAGCTVGFATPGQCRWLGYDIAVPHRNDRHETENFLALARALVPDAAGEPAVAVPEAPSSECPVLPDGKAVFCHMWPSGKMPHLKEWPCEFWRELATALADGGYVPVFTGGPQDMARTEAFLDACNIGEWALSVAGRISFSDLAYHFSRAAAVVSVNTGTMHLAAITGAPTVGLHGPTNPLRWGPLGRKTASLLPRSGHSAYLNLGFEYPQNAEAVLRHLPVVDVLEALRGFGLKL